MTSKLALFGGTPVRSKPFPPHPIIGDEEKRAVLEILDSGRLSTFIAAPGEHFLGGKKIKEFERKWADHHGVKYAVSFNSATSALHAAVVAAGVQPGEEVIVPPYTFTSTATCALMHNAIPVFADVDEEVYGLDPTAVEQAITPLTRALIPVHLFGHPANLDEIMELAHKHNLKVIEDCAQAPGARYKGQLVGTIGDCGVFSFTETKNVTTGEGGMLITNDEAIAEAARLIRNHGETTLEGQTARTYSSTMLGWCYRMTEIDAALGIVQLGRMDKLNQVRIDLANYLTDKLQGIEGIYPPVVQSGCKHVYYVYALKYKEEAVGLPRDVFVEALNAEGIPVGAGYVRPLYLTPLYHDKKPFAFKHYTGNASYEKGLCATAEKLYERELFLIPIVRPPATYEDMDDVITAVSKILDHRSELSRAVDDP